jgi:hypothetical protein
VLHSGLHHSWVTGTVGDEETVVVLASELGEVVVPRDLEDFDASPYQASQLVVFETDVDGDHAHRTAGGVLEGGCGVWRVELGFLDGD